LEDLALVQGPTVTFNVFRPDGSLVGFAEVERLAELHSPKIQLRTGCLCNPGACQRALGLSDDQLRRNHEVGGHVCGDSRDMVDGAPTGAIRVSFGVSSILSDAQAVLSFLDEYFLRTTPAIDEALLAHLESPALSPGASAVFGGTVAPEPRHPVVLEQIWIYPVKSCQGLRMPRWPVSDRGMLLHDRIFAVVDTERRALRQKQCPNLAQVVPTLTISSTILTLNAPGMPSLSVELTPPPDAPPATTPSSSLPSNVRVCGAATCSAEDCGDGAASWFSQYLGQPCRLVRVAASSSTPQPQDEGRTRDVGSSVGFANEGKMLLVSRHSVDLLNKILHGGGVARDKKQVKNFHEAAADKPTCVTPMHFRPNLVVGGGVGTEWLTAAHEEDRWEQITVCSAVMRVVGDCARCAMVDIDPRTGQQASGTLRTLASYRRRHAQIVFGRYLEPKKSSNSAPMWLEEGGTIHHAQNSGT